MPFACAAALREQEKLGSSDVAEAIGEQSAMQKLIQQLKDSRQALVNAQDDMNFWKGKYHGLQVYSVCSIFFVVTSRTVCQSQCRVVPRSEHARAAPTKKVGVRAPKRDTKTND